ncbi:MAG: methionine--tRNA ligase [Thaumarchaeota archaeon]|nr:methionine--tRNA ligase [Nitrososphaerota archaeon]
MKKIVVTSALPYANGEIHLGHIASTYLPADIFTRYCRLKGHEAIHICATDDFGTPILIRAEQEHKKPEEYVAHWHKRDYEDFTRLGISFDLFYQTSSKENVEFVQYVFKKLYDNGFIYDKPVIQFYCNNDKKFLPDRYVLGKCPYCGAENQYSDLCEKCSRVPAEILDAKCAICGATPVKKETKHYFLKLSGFSAKLKEWLTGNKNLQDDVKNYVLKWIEDGLQDWDITRDITWGVQIPLKEADGKVLYGWFDNHLCYISSTLAYLEKKGINGKEFWNNAEIYHFIGKDIVYHHYLFLPSMRLGIDEEYRLPDFIPTRGHLMLQAQKISKSRNWYISLKDFLERYPADYLRFYIALITPYSQQDLNFDWEDFAARINNELIANVGNFVNRALSFAQTKFNAIVPEPKDNDDADNESINEIKKITSEVSELLDKNEIDKALKRILKFSASFNQYFQKKEPWANIESANNCIYISVNAVRTLAIVLEPYMPFSAEKIWKQLNLDGSVHEQKWDSASELLVKPNHKLGSVEPLFKKIDAKEIEVEKRKLGK